MMDKNITPTPWRVEEGTDLIWGACTDDPSTYGMGYSIVEGKIPGFKPYKPSMKEREANAAFIVKAVNAHDALVDCLKWLDRKGGLGIEVHERIRGLLASIKETS